MLAGIPSYHVEGCDRYWCLVVPVDALIVWRVYLWHPKSSILPVLFWTIESGWAPKASSWESYYVDRSFWMVHAFSCPNSHLVPFVFCSISTTIQNIGQMRSVGDKHEFILKCSFSPVAAAFLSAILFNRVNITIWHPPPPQNALRTLRCIEK